MYLLQEGTSDGVAISPPPEGASVAEAKPVGLAIAGAFVKVLYNFDLLFLQQFSLLGPGGVASAKPQATAVAGPGGLAIARPVGTAIAGVDVEGSIPIGAHQHKNNKKKKPKQGSSNRVSYCNLVFNTNSFYCFQNPNLKLTFSTWVVFKVLLATLSQNSLRIVLIMGD